MQTSFNRRHNYVVKDFIIPISVAIVIGLGVNYIANGKRDTEIDMQLKIMEKQIVGLSVVMNAVQANQIELAARGAWMQNVNDKLKKLDNAVDIMYTNQLGIAKLLEWRSQDEARNKEQNSEFVRLWNFIGDVKTSVDKNATK